MSEHIIQQDDQPQSVLGPGEKLQAARISLGMTLDEVAKKMCLSTAILNSLEDNNFKKISAPIFVKGYLRSYARLVNINEDKIIEQYSDYNTEGDPPISSTSNISSAINSDGARIRRITYLVLFGLVISLSSWWWSRSQQPAETLSLEAAEKPILSSRPEIESTEEIAVQAPQEVLVESDVVQPEESAPLVEQVSTNEMQSEIETTVAAGSESADSVGSFEPVEATDTESVSQFDVIEEVTGEVTEEVTEVRALTELSIETEQPQKPIQQSGLVITVNADSWVNIKDADGNKLVYNLLHSGEQITVDGKAPLRAFLGNGHGVILHYQGEEIDISAFIRDDNTARLRIGQ